MAGHILWISLVLLAVTLNHVTCDYRAECPALAGQNCTFDGKVYPDGSYIEDQCLRLRCDDGKWVVTGGIVSDCGKCNVFLDPHTTTSDGYTFDLIQDPCNYSLIQTGFSSTPDVGIFGQFKECKGLGSCVGRVVFKDGADSVEIGKDGLDAPNIFKVYLHGTTAYVVPDGDPNYIPGSSMLAWRSSDSCIQLMGASGLSMEKCEYHQIMWSHPNNAPYYGLCGFFEGDNNVDNDLTLRTNDTLPLNVYMVPSFGYSWLTDDQENPVCPGAKPSKKQSPSLCLQNDDKKEEHGGNCTNAINSVKVNDVSISEAHFQIILDACIYDLCLISQSTGDDQDKLSEWLEGPVKAYTERIIYLELTSLGCEFDGQNYLQGDIREKSCYFYRCHHGQWKNTEIKVPSCCSSGGEDYENGEEAAIDCQIKVCRCGSWQDTDEMDPTCCERDGTYYEDGEELTFNCKVNKCVSGNWNAISDDPNCCEHNGVEYESGEQETFDCWVQECNQGSWDHISRDPDCCERDGTYYEDGDELTFNCKVNKCVSGNWNAISDDPDCCEHNGVKYESGEQETFDCWVQVCNEGSWDHISRDPDCCERDGTYYEDGEELTFNCKVNKCVSGNWNAISDDPDCCERDGTYYEDGEELTFNCKVNKCVSGNWNAISDDPNCCRDGNNIHPEGTTRTVKCVKEQCIRGTFVDTGDRAPNCCEHHGTVFPDGASKKIDCHVYICKGGEWEKSELTDPTCCEIGGRLFKEGTHAVVECNIFECVNGTWTDTHTKDPDCGHTGTSEHTEHKEGCSGCDETEACHGIGGGIIIQVEQQVNNP